MARWRRSRWVPAGRCSGPALRTQAIPKPGCMDSGTNSGQTEADHGCARPVRKARHPVRLVGEAHVGHEALALDVVPSGVDVAAAAAAVRGVAREQLLGRQRKLLGCSASGPPRSARTHTPLHRCDQILALRVVGRSVGRSVAQSVGRSDNRRACVSGGLTLGRSEHNRTHFLGRGF